MTEKMFIPKDKNLLDPKKDSIFKTIFASAGESSRIALKSLVTAIIGYEPQSVEVINNELSKNAVCLLPPRHSAPRQTPRISFL